MCVKRSDLKTLKFFILIIESVILGFSQVSVVSFDVKSLFTNVPRAYTIDKICNFFDKKFGGIFMQSKDDKSAAVDTNILKKVLTKCTQGHFLFDKKVFTQIDESR